MEKTIQLGDKAYRLHSSLFTIIEYKNVFSTELFNDIKKLDGSKRKQRGKLIWCDRHHIQNNLHPK